MNFKQWVWLLLGALFVGAFEGCTNGNMNFTWICSQPLSLDANSIGTGTTQVTFSASAGSCYNSVTVDEGSGFSSGNICQWSTIFGLSGSAGCNLGLESNESHNVFSSQVTQAAEVSTYAGISLPSNYRDIPKIVLDVEGGYGSAYCVYAATSSTSCSSANANFIWTGTQCINPAVTSSSNCTGTGYSWVSTGFGCTSNCSPTVTVPATAHAGYTDCGGSGFSSISNAIQDCAEKNGQAASWNGAYLGTHGEGAWNLVAHRGGSGSGKEVWQDQKTGLLWSTESGNQSNWCEAAGNTESSVNGSANCSAGGGLQPSSPVSYCAEMAGLSAGFSSETLNSGPYAPEKGGMGSASTPAVRWRLPTTHDYMQADVDGLRTVMPDMSVSNPGSQHVEWTATVSSSNRTYAITTKAQSPGHIAYAMSTNYYIRCVGR